MLYINKITKDPSQIIRLNGLPGVIALMTLRYMPRIQAWQMGLQYNDFKTDGIRVTLAPNMLRQFKNEIPFGICCIAASGLDPYHVNDFATQAANLYLLDASDVQTVEESYFT